MYSFVDEQMYFQLYVILAIHRFLDMHMMLRLAMKLMDKVQLGQGTDTIGWAMINE